MPSVILQPKCRSAATWTCGTFKLGGVKGKLGYPIADETLTPDNLGRMSVFEHGEIWWYPDKGAHVHTEKQR